MTVYTTTGREAVSSEEGTAAGVSYDNAASGLAATNVQDAIDEAVAAILRVIATADQVKNADAVMADDDTLVAVLEAGKTYHIEVMIVMATTTTADYKSDFNYTGTAAYYLQQRNYNTYAALSGGSGGTSGGTAVWAALNSTETFNFTGNATAILHYYITIQCTTGGTFSYRWAQNTSTAVNTTRYRGSKMILFEAE